MSLRCLFRVAQSALLTDPSCSSVCRPTKPQSSAAMWHLSAACSATRSRTSSGSNTSRSTAARWDQTDSRIFAFSRFVCVVMARFYSFIIFSGCKSSLFSPVLYMSKNFCCAQKTLDGHVKYIRPHRMFKLEKCVYFSLPLISIHSGVFMATSCAIKSVFIHLVNWSSRWRRSCLFSVRQRKNTSVIYY